MDDRISERVKALYGLELAPLPAPSQGRRFKIGTRHAVRITLAMILVLELIVIHSFCKFIVLQQKIFAQGSRIEVEYQRRDNLIPRLADISRNYAQHERELIQYVADARTLKHSSSELRDMLGPTKSAQMDKVFSRLIALAEQYPDLKAERSYQALMAKIVTTENRIAKAREGYVADINEYNRTIQIFPYAVLARLMRFKKMDVYAPEKEPSLARDNRFYFIY